MTFQGLVRDYFPSATTYGKGLLFVENRMLPFQEKEESSELIKGEFGGLYKFCIDRENEEEWIKEFKQEQPQVYTMCCVILYSLQENILPETLVDFSKCDIPFFFEEDPMWNDYAREVLEKKLTDNPTVMANKYFRLLLEDKEFVERTRNIKGFAELFEKGLEKLIEESSKISLSKEKKLPFPVRLYPRNKNLRWMKYKEVGYVFNPSSGELLGTCSNFMRFYGMASIEDKSRFENIAKKYNLIEESL